MGGVRGAPGWRLPYAAAGPLVFLIAALLLAPYHHNVTASVEADFPAYVAHALGGDGSLRWDGFVPVGYPRLLAWTSALTGNRFAAGVLLSATGGLALVAVTYGLARTVLSPRAASVTATAAALDFLVLQTGLLAGTDSLWAAAVLGALLLLVHARRRDSPDLYRAAGALLGLSALLRYATLAVVPAVVLVVALDRGHGPARRRLGHAAGVLALALVTSCPQWVVALEATGRPFASHQAKNVWFGLHGAGDWRSNWDSVTDDIDLLEVVGAAPGAFALHLLRNVGVAVAQALTWPFGLAPSAVAAAPLRLLAPVALAAGAIGAGQRAGAAARLGALLRGALRDADARLAAAVGAAYAVAISTAFWFPRFFLPLLPLVLVAGAVALRRVLLTGSVALRPALLVVAAFLAYSGVRSASAWTTFLASAQQPLDDVRVALVAAGAADDAVVATSISQHWANTLPWAFAEVPPEVADLDDLQQFLAASDAHFLIWETAHGAGHERPEIDVLLETPWACEYLEPLYIHDGPLRVVLFRAR